LSRVRFAPGAPLSGQLYAGIFSGLLPGNGSRQTRGHSTNEACIKLTYDGEYQRTGVMAVTRWKNPNVEGRNPKKLEAQKYAALHWIGFRISRQTSMRGE
jgi:hypothetical protein